MRKINRRNFLKVTGVLAAASALAACGGSSTSTAGSTGSTAGSAASADGAKAYNELTVGTDNTDLKADLKKKITEERQKDADRVFEENLMNQVAENSTADIPDVMVENQAHQYLDNYKAIWDLYTTDSATTGAALATATGDESEAEFGEGKAAFYQNGSWEYSNLTGTFGMNPDDLAMIPIYCGVDGEEEAGLCAGTENCWAINNEASEEDIQATIDFLVWVVTSDEGTTMLAQEFGPCPFKDAKEPENVFFQDANKYTADGKYVVTWAFNWTPAVDDWRAAVVDALTQYTAGTGDWSAVETAFVQGWATLYAKDNA